MPKLFITTGSRQNPYLGMIYSAFDGYEQRVFPLSKFHGSESPSAEKGDIFWIHWEDRQFGDRRDEPHHADRLKSVESGLLKLKEKGVRIVWTAHNYYPHNSARNMDLIDQVRRMLMTVSDVVHVHTPYAKQLLAENYDIPAEKFLVVAHPSYFGFYEVEEVTRRRRDILPDRKNRAFVHIGRVQENRGGQLLWAGLAALGKRRNDWELEIAGKITRSEKRGSHRIREMENVTFHDQYLPNDEFVRVVGSCHVCVAPFDRLLTSGSVKMALTMGLPVIGPDVIALRQHLPEPLHAYLHTPKNKRSLMFRMRDMLDLSDSELLSLRQQGQDFAWDIRPEVQSAALLQGVGG